MNSKQFRWIAIMVGLLIIINIVLVARIWTQDKKTAAPPSRPADARSLLVKELALNADQQKAFDSLRRIHFNQMDEYRHDMRKLKDDYFSMLETAEAPDSAAAAIGNVQTKIELSVFNHFRALRNICNREQQEKFDEIIQDVLRNMGPRPGGHPPGRPGGPPPHHPPGE